MGPNHPKGHREKGEYYDYVNPREARWPPKMEVSSP
jgi:hypothetical protein